MPRIHDSAITRRAFLAGASGVAVVAAWPPVARGLEPDKQFTLVAAPARVALVGGRHPQTDVWGYDGRVPGPTIRVKQGQPLRVSVDNRLAEDTTVHWHGVRL